MAAPPGATVVGPAVNEAMTGVPEQVAGVPTRLTDGAVEETHVLERDHRLIRAGRQRGV